MNDAFAPYCCRGCRAVHAILTKAGLTRYYDLRRGPGLPPADLESRRIDHKWLELIERRQPRRHLVDQPGPRAPRAPRLSRLPPFGLGRLGGRARIPARAGPFDGSATFRRPAAARGHLRCAGRQRHDLCDRHLPRPA
ncbi:MAG: heavy metal translocating P-type ATPase metal-binding domain-containing protein [Deltaproteobacteria bacterium]|nr:heavy metal translocating P-type ATPase metal-binding domain-containing protein [Deltaproteobacteria bacterium]